MSPSRAFLALPLATTLLLGFTHAAQATEYRITFNPAQPLVAQVEVSAAPVDNKATRINTRSPLITRSEALGVRELVSRVRCDGVALKRSDRGWTLPKQGCARITWTIAFAQLGENGADASAQENLFHPGSKSWLLSEPASLLRWPGSGGRVVIRGARPVLGGMLVNQDAAQKESKKESKKPDTAIYLPRNDDLPEYLLIGAAPLQRLEIPSQEFTYARWATASLETFTTLEKAHALAIARFMRIGQLPPPASLVVWLPIDIKQGGLGAATGAHTVLANLAVQKGVATPESLPYTLAALLQAQFAQMSTTIAEQVPLWVSVSLSEYYVRKALSTSGLNSAALEQIESAYLPTDTAPTALLPTMEARPDGGRLLMNEGSTFWLALDRAIQTASQGTRSLDDELPEILRTEFGSARLPFDLIERLRKAAGPEVFDALQARYLGSME